MKLLFHRWIYFLKQIITTPVAMRNAGFGGIHRMFKIFFIKNYLQTKNIMIFYQTLFESAQLEQG